jgi:hypothetical protein
LVSEDVNISFFLSFILYFSHLAAPSASLYFPQPLPVPSNWPPSRPIQLCVYIYIFISRFSDTGIPICSPLADSTNASSPDSSMHSIRSAILVIDPHNHQTHHQPHVGDRSIDRSIGLRSIHQPLDIRSIDRLIHASIDRFTSHLYIDP